MATHTTGAYLIYTPTDNVQWVNSPPRFHNGCSPYTEDYYDAPQFDGGPGACISAAGGQWAMDLNGIHGDNVYIDIQNGAINGWPAGGTYRVVAGEILEWDASVNGDYQLFGVHIPNGAGGWQNHAWFVLGHLNTWVYTVPETVIFQGTGRATFLIGKIAPYGASPPHVHAEYSNYFGFSRPYDWDGPGQANEDTVLSGPCSRSSSSPTSCNAQVYWYDVIGYVGGASSSFVELNNPNYPDF